MKKIILMAAALAFGTTVNAADPAAGKAKAKVCAACHGEGGVSTTADFPKLAGQYADYIEQALKAYQSGARKNPVMAEQAKNLKAADIADLAAYFSSQQALVGKK